MDLNNLLFSGTLPTGVCPSGHPPFILPQVSGDLVYPLPIEPPIPSTWADETSKARLGPDGELTPAQEKKMVDFWNKDPANPPSLKQITIEVFGAELDGRSHEGKAIKRALARHNLKARTATPYDYKIPVGEVALDDVQKEYIKNNARTMNPLDMAKILFNNQGLSNLHAETRAVAAHVRTLDVRAAFVTEAAEDVPTGDYKAPRNLDGMLKRVNMYMSLVDSKDKLTFSQKKNLDNLIGYMNNFRFTTLMNSYASENERKLCEDAFIRYTFDKPDLTQEEVDQYILLCNEIVMSFDIKRRGGILRQRLENVANDTDAKISIALVDAISESQSDYNECVKRQQSLLGDLKEKRSKRLDKNVKDNASVLNLIELWKQEETRKQLIAIARKETAKVTEEVEKLSNVADVRARILGLIKDEIKYE